MSTIDLFGFAQSTYVRTARLVCEEKNIDYTMLPLEFKADSHRMLHPYLKMPVLQHGDLIVYETLAIATYLNEQFQGPDLNAGTLVERARIAQWISASCDYIYAHVVSALAKTDTVEIEKLDDALNLLHPFDQALADSKFLAHDDLTLADLFLFPMLSYANNAIGNRGWISELVHLGEWLDRMETRPGVTRTAS